MEAGLYRYKAKILKVIDGDTLQLELDLGFHLKATFPVRLYGVNTPETHGVKKASEEYKKGSAATSRVLALCPIGSEVVIRTYLIEEKYGRVLADVYYRSSERGVAVWCSLATTLINEGLAVSVTY